MAGITITADFGWELELVKDEDKSCPFYNPLCYLEGTKQSGTAWGQASRTSLNANIRFSTVPKNEGFGPCVGMGNQHLGRQGSPPCASTMMECTPVVVFDDIDLSGDVVSEIANVFVDFLKTQVATIVETYVLCDVDETSTTVLERVLMKLFDQTMHDLNNNTFAPWLNAQHR